jgi:hypothetical protein
MKELGSSPSYTKPTLLLLQRKERKVAGKGTKTELKQLKLQIKS